MDNLVPHGFHYEHKPSHPLRFLFYCGVAIAGLVIGLGRLVSFADAPQDSRPAPVSRPVPALKDSLKLDADTLSRHKTAIQKMRTIPKPSQKPVPNTVIISS